MTEPGPMSDAAVGRLLAEAVADGGSAGDSARRAPSGAGGAEVGARWALLMLTGARQGTKYRLPRHGGARVGRAVDNWICLDGEAEASISQHHARITVEGEALRIQDLGSTNGTFVNGQRVTGAGVALKEGDVVDWAQCARAMVARVE